MVQMVLKLQSKAAGAADLSRALRIVMLPAQRDRACVSARLFVEVGDPDSLLYSEEWLTAEDLAREIRSPRFGRLLEVMETAAEPPQLQFRFVSETRSLDYVAEVRGVEHPSAE